MSAESARHLAGMLKTNQVRWTIHWCEQAPSFSSLSLETQHFAVGFHPNRCRRSGISGRCTQNQSCEIDNQLWDIVHYLSHFVQALTHLNLWNNEIGTEGARSLTDALKVNQVRCAICSDNAWQSRPFRSDTHQSLSWRQQHRGWRSEILGGGVPNQSSANNNLLRRHILVFFTL